MPTISDRISYHSLLTDYLPRGAFYVVRNFQDWAFAGILEDHLPLPKSELDEMRRHNDHGYDVFWTANAVKEERGNRTHDENNLYYINACYTELDILSTKVCAFDEDFKRREEYKAMLAGHIMFAECPPSMVIESRNGYHLYWFTNPDLSTFQKIQQGIYDRWKSHGADSAVKNPLRLLRVPGFYNHKNGEKFLCQIRMELCARNDDGSFMYYPSNDLLAAFPLATPCQPKTVTALPRRSSMFRDIFRFVKSLPQNQVFERCNGSALTGGELFTLTPLKGDKQQIRSNGRPTPCWIDLKANAIFSNNVKGHYGIVEFALWYGLELPEIAKQLKLIFPEWNKK